MHLLGREPAELGQGGFEQRQLAFPEGAQQVAGPELAGVVQLGDQPLLGLLPLLRGGGRRRQLLQDGRAVVVGREVGMDRADRLLQRLVERVGIDVEAGDDGGLQAGAHPGIELLGQAFGQPLVAHQRRTQGRDLLGGGDQPLHAVGRDVGGVVAGQGGQHRRLFLGQDGVDDQGPDVRAPGHLDLVLDGGLDQEADQVAILQHRAGGDDRTGDLDVVQRQHVDQGAGRPGGVGQLFGEPAADFALGLDHQAHEDVVQQRLHRLGVQGARAIGAVAQVGDGEEQPLAVSRRARLGQLQQAVGLGGDVQGVLPTGRVQRANCARRGEIMLNLDVIGLQHREG